MTPFLLLAAAEGGPIPGESADILSAVTTLVVSAALFTLLAVTVWPTIVKALDARNEKILGEIRSAEEAGRKARAAMDAHAAELVKAREEAAKMIAEAREQARRTAEEMQARNEAEMASRLAKAAADIDAAKRRAVGELHAEAATLATAVASRILGREINAADQQRLVEETLSGIASDRRN
jgi:F-type H+-transporting ATPase subunit b